MDQLQDDQDPTATTGQVKPVKPAVTAPALPVAGGSPQGPAGGAQTPLQASTGQAGAAPAIPVAPAQTSDPMAFQPPPSGTSANVTNAPLQAGGQAQGDPTKEGPSTTAPPTPSPAWLQYQKDHPFGAPGGEAAPSMWDGVSEADKVAYYASQNGNTTGLVGGGYTPGPKGYNADEAKAGSDQYMKDNAANIKAAGDKYGAMEAQGLAARQPGPAPTTLDDWWKLHGQGDRYQTVGGNRQDMAAGQYNAINQTPVGTNGMDQATHDSYGLGSVTDAGQATKDAQDRFAYAQTHGGFDTGYTPSGSPPPAPGGGGPGDPAQAGPNTGTPPTTGGPQQGPRTGYYNDPYAGGALPIGQPAPVGPSGGAFGPGSSSGGIPRSTDPRVGNGVQSTATTPDNALTNSTISVDPGVDRFAVANRQLQDTITNTLNPAEKAQSNMIAANSFGAGRGVSGMNRTAEGNLESNYNNQRNQLASNFLNPALTGSIDDAYKNAGIAQQQQGFQAGQQQTGFNQSLAAQNLSDNENQQSFDQAYKQLLAGSEGDPAKLQMLLASIYGGQSAQSAQAAQNLAGSF